MLHGPALLAEDRAPGCKLRRLRSPAPAQLIFHATAGPAPALRPRDQVHRAPPVGHIAARRSTFWSLAFRGPARPAAMYICCLCLLVVGCVVLRCSSGEEWSRGPARCHTTFASLHLQTPSAPCAPCMPCGRWCLPPRRPSGRRRHGGCGLGRQLSGSDQRALPQMAQGQAVHERRLHAGSSCKETANACTVYTSGHTA
jgi:hypothetical protein